MVSMPQVLLIITGSIAAYKSLELIRLLRKENVKVRVILTGGGAQFITPLSCATLTEEPVYTDLFSLTDETEMGHIRLAREADLIVVAPATADIIAKVAEGRADDLASTTLLTTTKPILIAPAMNMEMWNNPATQTNVALLKKRGITFIGPEEGELACGEFGRGKVTEPSVINTIILNQLYGDRPLKGLKALVTAGPTQEPFDPVRFISNPSSGKQGYAIAETLLEKGADVTLITGPTEIEPPEGVHLIRVITAEDMWKATESALPVHIAICSAAVSDYRPENPSKQKLKKKKEKMSLVLEPTVDILASLSTHSKRPRLLIGFAAETENLIQNAKQKLTKCDWVLANDIHKGIFKSDENEVTFITTKVCENWPRLSKKDVARKLVKTIIEEFK
jgi:phosphopantothenoylcysteine decarboxylase/phosphopantothenate--cysteine ligase